MEVYKSIFTIESVNIIDSFVITKPFNVFLILTSLFSEIILLFPFTPAAPPEELTLILELFLNVTVPLKSRPFPFVFVTVI